MGKETGTTFPVSVQDKQVNALLDTGAEKSCMSMDLFGRLKLSLNALKVLKLRNASGRDMVTHEHQTVMYKAEGCNASDSSIFEMNNHCCISL